MKCLICGKERRVLGNHLIEHKISTKEYYDTFLKKFNDGKCIICGKETKFKTLNRGYAQYCSTNCKNKNNSPDRNAWKRTRIQKIQQFEKEHNCVFANDLRTKYGHGWYLSNIVNFIYMDSQTKFVSINDIPKIIKYASIKRPHYSSSHAEKDIVNYIQTFYNGIILENKRKIIYPKELDIYIPDLKLAVEYNGNWYHSIEAGTSKNYHLEKSLMCREKV